MFRLYGYVSELKCLKKDNDEEEIIKALGKYIYKVERIQFMIIKNEGYGDEAYKIILNEKDYLEYIQEYVINNKPLTRKKVKK